MYTLQSAVLFARNKPTGFEVVDVSTMTLKKLLDDYLFGYLILSNNNLSGELFLTLDSIRKTYLGLYTYNITIPNWLTSNGNKMLPHTLVEPSYDFSTLYYADAMQAGFRKLAVHPSSTIEGYPLSSLTDLYLKKENIEADTLNNNTIFVVNGYLHTHSTYKDGVKISDGTKTLLYSKQNQIGVLSFLNCGGVELVNLTQNMINKTNVGLKYYEEMLVNLDQDLTGKTVWFSIAGQLVHAKDVIKVIDPSTGRLILNLARLNLIDRMQTCIKTLSIDDLLFTDMDQRTMPLNIEHIQSDAFILTLMRLSQTFAIVIDQPYVGISKEPVMFNSVYGRYFSAKHGYRPMMDEYGRIVPYFYQGASKHPYMHNRYHFNIPKEYVEKSDNLRDTAPWRYRPLSVYESVPFTAHPMRCSWLNVNFVKPA